LVVGLCDLGRPELATAGFGHGGFSSSHRWECIITITPLLPTKTSSRFSGHGAACGPRLNVLPFGPGEKPACNPLSRTAAGETGPAPRFRRPLNYFFYFRHRPRVLRIGLHRPNVSRDWAQGPKYLARVEARPLGRGAGPICAAVLQERGPPEVAGLLRLWNNGRGFLRGRGAAISSHINPRPWVIAIRKSAVSPRLSRLSSFRHLGRQKSMVQPNNNRARPPWGALARRLRAT